MCRQLALRAAPVAANGLVLADGSAKVALSLMRVFVRERTAMLTQPRGRCAQKTGRSATMRANVRHWHKRIQCGRFATQRAVAVRGGVGEQLLAAVGAEHVLAPQRHLRIHQH
jgi:hypothetical protein